MTEKPKLHTLNVLPSRGYGKTKMMEEFIQKLEASGKKVHRHLPTFEEKIRNLERPLPADLPVTFYDPSAHTRLNVDVIIKRDKERPAGGIPLEFCFDYKLLDSDPPELSWTAATQPNQELEKSDESGQSDHSESGPQGSEGSSGEDR